MFGRDRHSLASNIGTKPTPDERLFGKINRGRITLLVRMLKKIMSLFVIS